MAFSQKQKEFYLKSNKRINLADGSVRSGKTYIFNYRWLKYLLTGPKGDLLMAGKTLRTLERNVLFAKGGFLDLVGRGHYRYNRSTGELLIGDRRIYCVGASDERAESKIRGLTLAGAYCDEVTLFPENFVKQLLARCSVKKSQLFWNCNPDSPLHYIKKDFIDNPKLKKMMAYFTFHMEDNPSLDQAYQEDLKTLYTGVWYDRYILGKWTQAEGLVYDMFEEKVHVKEVLVEAGAEVIVSVDYGTLNPTVFLMWSKRGEEWVCFREYYYSGREEGKQKTDLEFAEILTKETKEFKVKYVIVDPSAASFIAQLKKLRFHVVKANNDVLDGIRFTANLLKEGKLCFHPSCKRTIEEFLSYMWDPHFDEDKPKKERDHAMDAMRYFCYTALKRKTMEVWKN